MRSLKKYCLFFFLILFEVAAAMSKGGVTPEKLYETVQFGSDKEIAKVLIRGRKIINGKFGEDGDSLLMVALKAGRNFKTISTIINYYVDIDFANEHGDTALIYAIKYDADEKTIKEIIESDAATRKAMKKRVGVKNNSGMSAIDFTEEGSPQEILLKKYGAKRTPPPEPEEEIQEEIFEEPEEEIFEEEIPVEEIEETVEVEEEIPQEDAETEEDSAEKPEISEEIDLEIPQEAFLASVETQAAPKSLRDMNERTYLFEGLETFETYEPSAPLPEKIEAPDAKDENGRTMLQNAAAKDDAETMRILLASGANVNLTDRDGWTALMYAARFAKNGETAAALIKAGANVKAKNRFGANALEIAASYGESADVLDTLAGHSAKNALTQAFFAAVGMGRPRHILEVFFRHGITANTVYKGKTPLMLAAQTNTDTDCIEFLLENGANKTFVTADRKDAYYFAKRNPNLPRNDVFWSLNNSEK